ncbi:MAG: carboxypeptidase regulatory-like domain-containing protein [Vicinamibacterales bacterium]
MRTHQRILQLVVTVACALLWPIASHGQERFGAISGTVTDSQHAAVPGASVTVVNDATGASRLVVSGADGTYSLTDVEPGRYSIAVELQGFQKVEAHDLRVLLGRTLEFPAVLTVGSVTEVVNVTAEQTRQIDLNSVTLAHNVTAEELDRLPKGRSFQSVALVAPGVNAGEVEAGFTVHGASGAENSFLVDGVPTNSLIDGRARGNTVFEYLQEVQVKTGGISAEYGGALGGVISAVTKSGGNKFTGEAHYYYIGNGISAGPVPRLQLSPSDDTTVFHVQDPKQKNNQNEAGGSVGGPILRNRLFFYASVSPRFQRRTNNYLFSNGTDPGSLSSKTTFMQSFGKLTYSAGRLQANGSILSTPTTQTGTLSAYNGTGAQVISSSLAGNAAQIGRGFKQQQTNIAGNVDFYLTNSSFVSVRGGLFNDNYFDTGVSTQTAVVWNTTSIGVAGLPSSLQQPLGYQNTPRTCRSPMKIGPRRVCGITSTSCSAPLARTPRRPL